MRFVAQLLQSRGTALADVWEIVKPQVSVWRIGTDRSITSTVAQHD